MVSKNSSSVQKNVPRVRLRMAREAQGWSQEELGTRLGTSQITVSRWETGESTPSPYFRSKLSRAFNTSPEELDLIPTRLSGTAHVLIDPLIPLVHPPVGREQELTHFKARLCTSGSASVVALYGLPGVGKTTLAATLAHDPEIRAHFSDGVLWAGLGKTPDIGQLRRWAALFGLHKTQTDSKNIDALAVRVRSAIGDRRMLLVLDDAWTVEDALAFQVGGPGCVHIVTTRFPQLAMHFTPGDPVHVHELNKEQSLDLLHELAPQIVEQEASRVRALVEAVGGLPLALTLTGNYLRLQTASGPRRRRIQALDRLTQAEMRLHLSEPRGPTQRHPSMPTETSLSLQSIIAVTDQQLNDEASAALYALAVLPSKPDSFSEEAALAVTASSLDTIDTLLNAGLLESSSEGRCMLHQTIADYARLHLQGIAPHERLIQYVHKVVEAHRDDYEVLDLEAGTLLAALEAAYTLGKKQELVRNACELMPYLIMRNNYELAESSIQRAYEAATILKDDRAIVMTLLYRGQIAHKRGNYVQAEATFQQALGIARQSQNADSISAVLRNLGWISWKLGSNARAETYLNEGLLLARQSEDLERISDVLQTLGSVVGYRSDYIQETMYLHEALALARTIGDRARICETLIHLGISHSAQGNNHQAEIYFQEGLTLACAIDHKEWITALLTNLGDLVIEMGNYSQAEEYLQEGLTLARQIGNREWTCVLLTNLGTTKWKRGDVAQAEIYLQKALELAGQLGIPLMQSNTLYEYGNLYLDQNLETAATAFQEMLDITPQDCQELVALAQYGLARVAAIQRKINSALQLGGASATVLEAIGHRKAKEVRDWLNGIQRMKEGAISISSE